MRLLVLTSPATGNADGLDPALEVLREGADVVVEESSTPEELARILAGVDGRTVVVAGGDGALHAIVEALHTRGDLATTTLALVPLGTGNDFARAVGVPDDAVEAARAVLAGRSRRLDILVDEGDRVVVNSVHTGAGAQAARAGKSWKERLGKVGYAIGAIQTLVKPRSVHVRVTVDDTVVASERDPVLQVVIGNGVYVGGGAALTPDADPTDGLADVLVSRSVGGLARAGYAVGVLLRRHPNRADVRTVRGSVVEVTGRRFWCSEDGELTGPHQRRLWRVVPAAYSLVVP